MLDNFGTTEFGTTETASSGIAARYTTPQNFTINATTGQITYTGMSAPHGIRTLYAQVSDNKNSANTADIAVDDTTRVVITTPNQAPAFTQAAYQFSIPAGADGSETAVLVGTVTATDPENDTITYSLTHTLQDPDSSESVFAINPDTGMIIYTGTPAAADTIYMLQAQASDNQSSSGSGTSAAMDTTTTITIITTTNTAPTSSTIPTSSTTYKSNPNPTIPTSSTTYKSNPNPTTRESNPNPNPTTYKSNPNPTTRKPLWLIPKD